MAAQVGPGFDIKPYVVYTDLKLDADGLVVRGVSPLLVPCLRAPACPYAAGMHLAYLRLKSMRISMATRFSKRIAFLCRAGTCC